MLRIVLLRTIHNLDMQATNSDSELQERLQDDAELGARTEAAFSSPSRSFPDQRESNAKSSVVDFTGALVFDQDVWAASEDPPSKILPK